MQNYKLARLYDADNDITKRWYVFYYFINPDTLKPDRFRVFISEKFLTKSGRRDEGHRLIKEINKSESHILWNIDFTSNGIGTKQSFKQKLINYFLLLLITIICFVI